MKGASSSNVQITASSTELFFCFVCEVCARKVTNLVINRNCCVQTPLELGELGTFSVQRNGFSAVRFPMFAGLQRSCEKLNIVVQGLLRQGLLREKTLKHKHSTFSRTRTTAVDVRREITAKLRNHVDLTCCAMLTVEMYSNKKKNHSLFVFVAKSFGKD